MCSSSILFQLPPSTDIAIRSALFDTATMSNDGNNGGTLYLPDFYDECVLQSSSKDKEAATKGFSAKGLTVQFMFGTGKWIWTRHDLKAPLMNIQ